MRLEAELRLNLAQACLTCGDAAAALGACDAYFALRDAPASNARDAKAHFRAARALEALDGVSRLVIAEHGLRRALAERQGDDVTKFGEPPRLPEYVRADVSSSGA